MNIEAGYLGGTSILEVPSGPGNSHHPGDIAAATTQGFRSKMASVQKLSRLKPRVRDRAYRANGPSGSIACQS